MKTRIEIGESIDGVAIRGNFRGNNKFGIFGSNTQELVVTSELILNRILENNASDEIYLIDLSGFCNNLENYFITNRIDVSNHMVYPFIPTNISQRFSSSIVSKANYIKLVTDLFNLYSKLYNNSRLNKTLLEKSIRQAYDIDCEKNCYEIIPNFDTIKEIYRQNVYRKKVSTNNTEKNADDVLNAIDEVNKIYTNNSSNLGTIKHSELFQSNNNLNIFDFSNVERKEDVLLLYTQHC